MGQQTIDLLIAPRTLIPCWFSRHQWQEHVRITENSALPPGIELQKTSMGNFNIQVSSREREALELLCLTPRLYSFFVRSFLEKNPNKIILSLLFLRAPTARSAEVYDIKKVWAP